MAKVIEILENKKFFKLELSLAEMAMLGEAFVILLEEVYEKENSSDLEMSVALAAIDPFLEYALPATRSYVESIKKEMEEVDVEKIDEKSTGDDIIKKSENDSNLSNDEHFKL